MTTYAVKDTKLIAIADKIRSKRGLATTDKIEIDDMPLQIDLISGGEPNWSEIGYTDTPQSVLNDFEYSKEVMRNWVNVADLHSKFQGDTDLVYMPMVDTSNATNMSSMLNSCSNLTTISLLDTSSVTHMISMFYGCSKLTTIPLLDTSSVMKMQYMFYGCSKLTTIPLLDTSSVNDMNNMFNNCSKLTTIPLLDTSRVTSMQSMFYGCSKLTTIPLLDTSRVTSMQGIFERCYALTTIPQLDTSKVTNTYSMFNYCKGLESIPLLDFSSVRDMRFMFDNMGTNVLTDLGGFKDLGKAYLTTASENAVAYELGMGGLSHLTRQSVLNVFNNLYDIATAGCNKQKVRLHATVYDLLSQDDLDIAINKGWNVQRG